jgi:hypothetical protein
VDVAQGDARHHTTVGSKRVIAFYEPDTECHRKELLVVGFSKDEHVLGECLLRARSGPNRSSP